MAGNYPDAPSWRMAYDKDGTHGVLISAVGVVKSLTSSELIGINNESSTPLLVDAPSTYDKIDHFIALVFPEKRDLDGWFISVYPGASALKYLVEVSSDTSNGQDGTWVAIGAQVTANTFTAVTPAYRSQIVSGTVLAITGFRLRFSIVSANSGGNDANVAAIHLYGEPAPNENPDRLELWHATEDVKLGPAALDWGNTPRASSSDRTFRVKNLSPTKTAAAVRVAMDVLTDGVPSVPGQHSLSHSGGPYLAQVNIGDLAGGAISSPVTLRRVTPTDAQLGVWALRVFADSTSWS